MTGPQASGDEVEGDARESESAAPTSKLAVSSLPGLRSDEVRNRGFKRATRGVSEAEVRNFLHRVAEELDAGHARERTLQHRIDQLEEEAAHPPPVTEEALVDALGAETARVLRSAQDAARHVRTTADEQGAAVVAEAETQARALRDEAEAFVAEQREVAQANADQLRSDAQETAKGLIADAEARASEIREVARTEADTTSANALEEARAMVAEAKSVRERVLTDLAKRRRVLHEQIQELRDGRERLLEGYQVVRRTLADATRALGADAPPDDLDLEAILDDGPEPDDPELERLLDEVGSDAAEPSDSEPPTPASSSANPDIDTDIPARGAEPTGPEDLEAAPDEEAVPQGSGLRRYVKGALGLGSDQDRDVVADDEEADASLEERSVEQGAVEQGAVEAAKPNPESVFAKLRSADTSEDPDRPSADAGNRVDSEGGQTDRAGGGSTTGAGSEPAAEAARRSADSEHVDEDRPALTGDAAVIAERDELLAPVQSALARAIKREAQNDQNELLDALRRAKRRKDLSPLLPDRSDMAAAWGDAAAEALSTAYGGDVPAALLVELSGALVGSLHERLAEAIAEGGDNEALTQRIGARYREWRSRDLAASVAEVTSTAHARGIFDRAGSESVLRWVAARPGRCPDCDDNSLEPTRRGDAFPTGQAFPPAHPGCRCMLVVET